MSINITPNGERFHIGFFGRRNAGKSSLVNAVTGQSLAVVSDTKGTTTDPVSKAMELLPIGPVLITDTAGFDDEGFLGGLRVKKTRQVLNKTDLAVLCVDSVEGMGDCENELISLFKEKEIPYIVVFNKCDITGEKETAENEICVSAIKNTGIYKLKEKIGSFAQKNEESKHICADLFSENDVVVLVTPIDSAAPKGRLILPQQQTIRELLERNCITVVIREDRIKETLLALGRKPAAVITDSQAFERVSNDVPKDIYLTSFSILMARYKGFLKEAVSGASAIKRLKDGDKVLISEGCTHHRQCEDIGTVKLPKWLKEYTGKDIDFETTSGGDFPECLSKYALVIHCGGCMLNPKEVKYRRKHYIDENVPITNFGTAIALMKGVLERSLEILPEYLKEIEK